ncbi:MAG TPA: protein kinase [Myxococcales bacterium LLY-WYZ-16_1]|nr:protein kinase [Myxococcales bacterium LLY-WYZ-16_1]
MGIAAIGSGDSSRASPDGFGAEVFLATTQGEAGFSRPVVIKRMLPQLAANEAYTRLFVREARIASFLRHPNIVQVLDFARDDDGQLFMVLEWVEGCDLWKLQKLGRLPAELIAHITGEILSGLHHAHTLEVDGKPANLVHRDISPHNVLISCLGDVKVSDFGIAKAAFNDTVPTESGQISGKVGYIAPERLRGRKADPRADLWAVGVVLYEMITRRRLFAGDGLDGLFQSCTQEIEPPVSEDFAVPGGLSDLCMQLLERDPDARISTAEEALERLHETDLVPRMGSKRLAKWFSEHAPHDALSPAASAAFGASGARGEAAAKAGTPGPAPTSNGLAGPERQRAWEHSIPEELALATRGSAPSMAGAPAATPWVGMSRLSLAMALVGALLFGASLSLWWHTRPPQILTVVEAPPPEGVDALPTGSRMEDSAARSAAEAASGPLQPGSDLSDEAAAGEPIPSAPATPTQGAEAARQGAADTGVSRAEDRTGSRPARRTGRTTARPAKGRLFIGSQPWAEVWVDGEKQSEPTPLFVKLDPGTHEVELRNPDLGRRVKKTVEISAGGQTRLFHAFER